ncbi:MAG: hypothetical protein ACKOU6_04215, partial [Planctomycetota bacterium]
MNHQQRRFLFPQRERIVRLDCVSRFGRTAHPIRTARTARTARVVAAVVLSCVMTVVLVGCYEPAIGLLVAPPADSVSKEEPGKIRLPLFTGWEKPALTIVVSGRQNGYIEPCGCAGLTNQKGGMARRYTLIRQLEERGWPVVPVDVGNQIKRFGRQSEIKFQIAYEALKKMGYQAIGLGPDDLRLSSGELFSS